MRKPTLIQLIVIALAILLVISLWGNFKLFDIGSGYKEKLEESDQVIENNHQQINMLNDYQDQLTAEIDTLLSKIDSIGKRDTIYIIRYKDIGNEHNETTTFIDNATTDGLSSYFTRNISPVDTVWWD